MASTDARPVPLKNTAFRLIFEAYKTDGTLNTGGTGMDSEVSKDQGAFTDCTNEATEIGTSGVYYLDLTSTEMNADNVTVKVTFTNTNSIPRVISLYPEEAGDIRVNVTQMANDVVTAAAVANGAIDASALASDAITAAKIAADAVTEIQSGLASQASVDAIDDFLDTEIAAILADTSELQGDLANGGRIDLLIDAIKAKTDNLPSDPADQSAVEAAITSATSGLATAASIAALNDLSAAEVNAEVDAALADYDPPTNAEFEARSLPAADYFVVGDYTAPANSDIAAVKAVTDDLALLLEDDGGTPRFTANALEEAPAGGGGGGGLDAAGVRAAIGLASANLDTQLADLPTNAELATALSAADDAILARLGTPAGASIAADIAAIEAQTDDIGAAGAGLTAVPWNAAWDAEVQSEVADALGVYDPPTRAELASDINSVLSALSVVAGYLDTEIAAILADTSELQTDWVNGGRLDNLIDALASALTLVKGVTDKVDTALEPDGGVYRFTQNALERAPVGEGGGGMGSDPLLALVPGDYEEGTAGYKLGLLGASNATVPSPLDLVTGNMVIVRGDDYTAAAGRALIWAETAWTPYSLTTAESITFRVKSRYRSTVFSKEAEALTDTAVSVELTSEETELWGVGNNARFELEAELDGGEIVTLAQGVVVVIEDIR